MPHKYKNLLGQRFGRLTVKKLCEKTKYGKKTWLCQCDCGKEIIRTCYDLTGGRVQSCGCLRDEKISKVTLSHGGTHTRLYMIWNGIKGRCNHKHNSAYKHYGARGITMCKEWSNFETFRTWAIENGYSESLTIDRIDVNGNYEPNNCRWVTMAQQADNKRTSKRFEYNGLLYTTRELSNEYGIPYHKLHYRIKDLNWSVEESIKYYKKELKKDE